MFTNPAHGPEKIQSLDGDNGL